MADDFLPPIVAVLTANTKEFQTKMSEATAKSKAETEEMSGHAQKFGMLAGASFMAAGAAAFEIGKSIFETTEKFDQAHAVLQSVIRNTGSNIDVFTGQLKKNENTFADLGYNATDYETALGQLVPMVGNTDLAMKDMNVAVDLAAAKHMDLAKAAVLVGKVATGNTAVLKRYVGDLGLVQGGSKAVAAAQAALTRAEAALTVVEQKIHDGKLKGTDASNAYAAATVKVMGAQVQLNKVQDAGKAGLDALTKRFGGTAATTADTLGGKIKALKAHVSNLEIEVGQHLNVTLDKLGKWMTGPQGAQAVDIFKASWDGFSTVLDSKVVPAVDRVTTDMAKWVDSITSKIAVSVNNFADDIATGVEKLDNTLANALGGNSHGTGPATSDAAAHQMADNYDKQHGYPIGYTWGMENAKGRANVVASGGSGSQGKTKGKGKALGGIESYPAAGALEILHGREAILPLDNPPAAARIAKEAGISTGGGSGNVHIGVLHLQVVSADPSKAGESVHSVLTDASFLRSRS